MLDYRLITFLTLCRTMSFSKAAQQLCITQPAVSQHIKFLEQRYRTKLIARRGRNIVLTEKGELLRVYAESMEADSERLEERMKTMPRPVRLRFGATLTIGEFLLPELLAGYLRQKPELSVTMNVENTEKLLAQLREGRLDFAIVEGGFDKRLYSSYRFSDERFVAVCGAQSPLADQEIRLESLCEETIIVREGGSGTRDILEHVLAGRNLSLTDFSRMLEIENFGAIKKLVMDGCGITFVYDRVVRQELKEGRLREIPVRGWDVWHEWNFIFLKNSLFQKENLDFYTYCAQTMAADESH